MKSFPLLTTMRTVDNCSKRVEQLAIVASAHLARPIHGSPNPPHRGALPACATVHALTYLMLE